MFHCKRKKIVGKTDEVFHIGILPIHQPSQIKNLLMLVATWVKITLALDIRKRVAISLGAKLSAIDTTTNPASTIAKYIITAVAVIGMSMAIASPLLNLASSAFATNLAKVN